MRCKGTQKLLILCNFVQQILNINRFFISFTIQLGDLAKKFVSLRSVKWD